MLITLPPSSAFHTSPEGRLETSATYLTAAAVSSGGRVRPHPATHTNTNTHTVQGSEGPFSLEAERALEVERPFQLSWWLSRSCFHLAVHPCCKSPHFLHHTVKKGNKMNVTHVYLKQFIFQMAHASALRKFIFNCWSTDYIESDVAVNIYSNKCILNSETLCHRCV